MGLELIHFLSNHQFTDGLNSTRSLNPGYGQINNWLRKSRRSDTDVITTFIYADGHISYLFIKFQSAH